MKSSFKPRTIDQYTDTEKVAAFEKMHARAMKTFNHTKENGCLPKDCQEYAWEEQMELLAHPKKISKFWDAFNDLRDE